MAHADLVAQKIQVATAWNEKELIKQVPGVRWNAHDKFWYAPLRWATCVMLRGVFGDSLTIGSDLAGWAWQEKDHVDKLLALRVMIKPDWDKWITGRLYPFQEVGARFLRLGREVLLGDEMGTGKTIQVLAALQPSDFPVVVICPNSVKKHWHNEVKKWTEYGVPYVVTGGAVGRRKIIEQASSDPYAVVIVNIEAVRLLSRVAGYGSVALRRCRECDPKRGEEGITPSRCNVHPKPLNQIEFKTVIVDEAHRIKDPQSQQTRAVWAVAHQRSVVNRWLLTGTPIANHPGDLWSLLHCMSPEDHPTKTKYVERYCLQTWATWGGLTIVGLNPANRAEFFKIFDPHWRRMPKELVLTQLPPKVRSVRWVDMTVAQAKTYRALENGLAALTDSGEVLTAANALVAKTRLMQLASSSVKITNIDPSTVVGETRQLLPGIYDDPHQLFDDEKFRVTLCEPSPKLDELEAILDELGDRQVAVCAESRQLINLAATRLQKREISFGLITGNVSEYDRDLALRRFQDGKLQVLLFTVKAGGVGLTMTAADTIVFLQRSWSMIDNRQAEDRVHRIGSERHESIHVIDVVTRGSIEEDQVSRLLEKFMRLQEIARDRATMLANRDDTDMLDQEEDVIMRTQL